MSSRNAERSSAVTSSNTEPEKVTALPMPLVRDDRRHLLTPISVVIGMIVGGELQTLGRLFLPAGPVKEFLTSGFAWQSSGGHTIPFVVGRFTFGPGAIDISLLAAAAVVLTVLLARAMFR